MQVTRAANHKDVRSVSELNPQEREYYKAFTSALHQGNAAMLEALKDRHFQSHDSDRDGRLSKAEVHALIDSTHAKVGLRAPPSNYLDVEFASCDVDGSGYIERDEFDELYEHILKRVLASFKVVAKGQPRSAKQDFAAKYELGRRLNSGAQGVTYLAKERLSGQQVVVKKPNDATDIGDFSQLVDKVHPNIVRVFDLYQSPLDTFVVMEFCPGGDLFGALKTCHEQFGMITFNFIAGSMQQVMRGLHYLHNTFSLCHNDIKPENILLAHKPGSPTDVPKCMLADFGCASHEHASTITGDPRYNAPELWPPSGCAGTVSFRSDVWALGVTLFEMLSGGLLIHTNHRNLSSWAAFVQCQGGMLYRAMELAMATGVQPDWRQIAAAGPEATHLCQLMLQQLPKDRLELGRALKHPWFTLASGPAQPLPAEVFRALQGRAGHCQMKMALLNLVASKLQGDSLDYYRQLWDRLDTDHSGHLSRPELVQLLTSPAIGMEPRQAEEVLNMADVDGSGQIDFNEFVAIMFNPDALTPSELEGYLASIFSELAGADARLSPDEFHAVFPTGMSRTIIGQLFSEIDADGNGTVDLHEFKAFVASM